MNQVPATGLGARFSLLVAILLALTLAVQCSVATPTPQVPAGDGSGPLSTPNFGPAPGAGDNPGATNRGLGPGNPGNGGDNVQNNPSGALPRLALKPQPQGGTYQGCPLQGDGGDPQLNLRKNRTDSAVWYPVALASILNLRWPQTVERHPRAGWSAGDAAAVAQYEGIPVQVEGWLAGAKQEGPEACNCHSPDDVDNHLWIVDGSSKDRSQSVVVEITPRMRALNPGWAFGRIAPLVDGRTKVRISGWLLLDPEHPDQIGKTRGTIWEIHPIVDFDVQRGSGWVSLNTGQAVAPADSAPPTEDPNLPPAIVDTPAPADRITPVPPRAAGSGGIGTGQGPLVIAGIHYQGDIKPNEPDEYVEIANTSGSPVDLTGWTLHDLYGGQKFTWQGFTLDAGRHIRVYTDQNHPESGGFSFGSRSAIWANKGDAAELLDPNGNVVSTFAYGNRR